MTSHRNLLLLFVGALAMSSASAADFGGAESAVRSLETAYRNKDINAAVALRDFNEEAKLMLQKINPELSRDASILKQTSEVLELAFRKEIKDKGFPDFTNLKCSFSKQQVVNPTLVKLTETCVFPDGGKSVQDLHVFNSSGGWRVVNVPQ
jgi:hypothetical protein